MSGLSTAVAEAEEMLQNSADPRQEAFIVSNMAARRRMQDATRSEKEKQENLRAQFGENGKEIFEQWLKQQQEELDSIAAQATSSEGQMAGVQAQPRQVEVDEKN